MLEADAGVAADARAAIGAGHAVAAGTHEAMLEGRGGGTACAMAGVDAPAADDGVDGAAAGEIGVGRP